MLSDFDFFIFSITEQIPPKSALQESAKIPNDTVRKN